MPPGKIAANINFDGGNVLGKTADLTFIGLGKSSLDAVVQSLAASQGRKLLGDQFPDRGFFYRSDQFNFAKIGVPAIYLDGGTDYVGKPEDWGTKQMEDYEEHHYHQPSDEYDPKWNFDGMIEDAQLGFFAGLPDRQRPQAPHLEPGRRVRSGAEAGAVRGWDGKERTRSYRWSEGRPRGRPFHFVERGSRTMGPTVLPSPPASSPRWRC